MSEASLLQRLAEADLDPFVLAPLLAELRERLVPGEGGVPGRHVPTVMARKMVSKLALSAALMTDALRATVDSRMRLELAERCIRDGLVVLRWLPVHEIDPETHPRDEWWRLAIGDAPEFPMWGARIRVLVAVVDREPYAEVTP